MTHRVAFATKSGVAHIKFECRPAIASLLIATFAVEKVNLVFENESAKMLTARAQRFAGFVDKERLIGRAATGVFFSNQTTK
jgi:hypothetical protein